MVGREREKGGGGRGIKDVARIQVGRWSGWMNWIGKLLLARSLIVFSRLYRLFVFLSIIVFGLDWDLYGGGGGVRRSEC